MNTQELLEITRSELNYIVACILQANVKGASNVTRRVGQSVAAKLIATGTTTGALGLVSTFATAGTGTAIASLSGAAATSATLSWVGGLVGGGMAAGTLMTGGLTLVVGVGAYALMGSRVRELEELTPIEMRAVETCSLLMKMMGDALDKQAALSSSDIRDLYMQGIKPLHEFLETHRDTICENLDIKNRMAFKMNALPDFERNVVIPMRALVSA